MIRNWLQSFSLFGGELLKNPGPTGAAAPSSPSLGRRMASYIPADTIGYIVELGAGTGAITQQLLRHGIAPEKLISIEQSEPMAAHLKDRFPNVKIIQGDATELSQIVENATGKPNTRIPYVVSGLPFRSLPDAVSEKIIEQIQRILPSEGRFIQFTYDLRNRPFRHFKSFESEHGGIVWLNFPPARVDCFRKKP